MKLTLALGAKPDYWLLCSSVEVRNSSGAPSLAVSLLPGGREDVAISSPQQAWYLIIANFAFLYSFKNNFKGLEIGNMKFCFPDTSWKVEDWQIKGT